MTKENEKEIIAKVLQGDTNAFGELVERYHKGLCIYLVNLLNDDMQAEDIAQDAFIRAFDRLETYNSNYSFSTWLYKIARNLALRYLENSTKLAPTFDTNMIETPTTESAQDSFQKDEQTASIQKAIASLKPEYQEVINLYYWNGKSYEEISEILDCPVNTVRTWLHRSKESIRKELYGQIG